MPGETRFGKAAADVSRLHKGAGEDCPESQGGEALEADWVCLDTFPSCNLDQNTSEAITISEIQQHVCPAI